MSFKGLTPAQLRERAKNLQLNGATAKVNMPRDDKYAAQPTREPLTDTEQAQVDAFREECQQTNALEALKEIDKVFGAWLAKYCILPEDERFAAQMIAILERALGKTSADKSFDADARTLAEAK